jgi:trehalose 6-phosphate synthase
MTVSDCRRDPQFTLRTQTRALADTHWSRVIVLANRAPFAFDHSSDGGIIARRSTSGVVTALEPLVAACSGTWVAQHDGRASEPSLDGRGAALMPPSNIPYRLRSVQLAARERRGFYDGFANEGLWPLCHTADVPPVFRPGDYCAYDSVNARFAAAAAAEAGYGAPLVLVQDYHFALAPRMVRRRLPASTVVAFWHIPWPAATVFELCPWACELLDGLLGSDVIGVQTERDCVDFLESVDAVLDADVDFLDRTVTYRGRTTRVRAYPVGIEWANAAARATPPAPACRDFVFANFGLPGDARLVVGIDRLDYAKGIDYKLLAIERLFERSPDLKGRFAFVQVAEPSRASLPAYRAARHRIVEAADRVNRRFGSDGYQPIHIVERHCEPADVYRLYRAADVFYVGSLQDGMNLVAKEFVCARDDERGVLVLSRGAGAAEQLRAAVLIDPRDIDASAGALRRALDMPEAEQSGRMRRLRSNVETFNASWWGYRLLEDAAWQREAAHVSAAHRNGVAI